MDQFVQQNSIAIAVGLFVFGLPIGHLLELWSRRMCRAFQLHEKREPIDYSTRKLPVTELLTAVLFATYFLAVFRFEAHTIHEVRPDLLWKYGRGISHLILLSLLAVATVTDFREYIIPDQITLPGMLIGIGVAVSSGDTQIIHLWVDWNQEIPGLRGPFIPKWIAEHVHLHGLAWSLAGLVAGGGITWLVRIVSSRLLGQLALGFGDVTLMAMIGTFLGWQPVIFAFLLAPLCGIFAGLLTRIFAGKTYVPYGPYLALATVGVLFAWRWLWMLDVPNAFSMRRFFGDAPGLGILAGISFVAFVTLLASVRLYRAIPTDRRGTLQQSPAEESAEVGTGSHDSDSTPS